MQRDSDDEKRDLYTNSVAETKILKLVDRILREIEELDQRVVVLEWRMILMQRQVEKFRIVFESIESIPKLGKN